MKKIKTIFDRDWEGNRGVVNIPVVDPVYLQPAIATEKLDGTNVRLTVRNHTIVRIEKRRNPSKLEKAKGIVDPWYVDASEFEAQDKHIVDASKNTDLSDIENGEWSGEAVGPKIQGNPLNLDKHEVVLFSHPETRRTRLTFTVNPPLDFDGLRDWLNGQKSLIGKDAPIEGVVWHDDHNQMFKIKLKDFK